MRSDIYKIEKNERTLDAILAESERVAEYIRLEDKQSMHLRLLCEELYAMLPEMIGDFEGKFWIDFNDGLCKVNASIEALEMSSETKSQLISVAKNKKNASASGFVGKIRSAIENFFLDMDYTGVYAVPTYGAEGTPLQYSDADYTSYWNLSKYKSEIGEDRKEVWDELEKSVITSIADDISVGVKGRRVDIIITKSFSKGAKA